MANKTVFAPSPKGQALPKTDTVNEAGGTAYEFTAEHALAQVAATGTFNETFYGAASDQLEAIKKAAEDCSDEFLAKCAVYARQKGYMKDMPAALAVILSTRNSKLLDRIFHRTIDNGKMIRNFVQIVRSGALGRKSLGSGPKRLISQWFNNQSDRSIFRASVGNNPSLADVIKLARPRPQTKTRSALYNYILGKGNHSIDDLPQIVRDFETFKSGDNPEVPDVDFRQLASLDLTTEQWAQLALKGGWTQTRMNLNTYARHGVFDLPGMSEKIAKKLSDPESVRKARAFPYQLMVAYASADNIVPALVKDALQDAMEIAVENVPAINGRVVVCPDISGSMGSPVTGYRRGSTSVVTCRLVAALVASSLLRVNKDALVLPFHWQVQPCELNPRDTVITNANKLAQLPSGGTDCSAPLRWINEHNEKADLVVLVSDNESWMDSQGHGMGFRGSTETFNQFRKLQKRNPGAKMICLDLCPYISTQAPDSPNEVMNIGGFSDNVFKTMSEFAAGKYSKETTQTWVGEINSIEL